jgi:hypothetical protein
MTKDDDYLPWHGNSRAKKARLLLLGYKACPVCGGLCFHLRCAAVGAPGVCHLCHEVWDTNGYAAHYADPKMGARVKRHARKYPAAAEKVAKIV